MFDLSAIASLGSAVSLVVFLVVGVAGLRLRAESGSMACGLFEGDNPSGQAERVRKDLQSVTADCKETLAAA